jgi:hypothetical protein
MKRTDFSTVLEVNKDEGGKGQVQFAASHLLLICGEHNQFEAQEALTKLSTGRVTA